MNNYNTAQKRLLVLSTAMFTDFMTQNSLDRDSIMSIAGMVTGLPLLLPYTEDDSFDSSSNSSVLINAGKISQVIQLLKGLRGDERMPLLVKLAVWYLYKAGTKKCDLDSAYSYIGEGLKLSSVPPRNSSHYRCLGLLAEYYRQLGKEPESRQIYMEMIASSKHDRNIKIEAGAWHHLGEMHASIDSLDVTYLSKSLALYRQLQMKEKEIELLLKIATYDNKYDPPRFKNELLLILQIQKSIGYTHFLFVEFLLSYASMQEADYLKAFEHSNAAFENMKWSEMSALEGMFYTRVGSAYWYLGKKDEAIVWYKKALEHRSKATYIYWYKTLFYISPRLTELNRPEETIAILEPITLEFPPITPLEKGMVYQAKVEAYRKLNNSRLADENLISFIKLTDEHPKLIDEFGAFYNEIINFYLSKSNLKAATLFLRKSMGTIDVWFGKNTQINHGLYKIDSSTGNYKSALKHYIQYNRYLEADRNVVQQKQFEELTIKYGAEKKDNDIKLLQKEKQLQGAFILQSQYTRNWILSGVALLLVIVCLLVYNSRLKQRANSKLKQQQTEINNQNITLRHLVNEKDWLVKEIHHRVKNNLQTVMGLLGTQSGYLKNNEAIDAINDSQRRIQSMSLIHQRLYQSNHLSAIKMTDYIHELVNSLSDSFNESSHVRFKMDIEPLQFDLVNCIPLGLILNESITNAFKYAFPANRHGVISISLKCISSNQVSLKIADNGIGLPAGFNTNRSDSMGMELMRGLCGEIGATFMLSGLNGTQIEIQFFYDLSIAASMIHSETETTILL